MEDPDPPTSSQERALIVVTVTFTSASVSDINAFNAEDELNAAVNGEVELRASVKDAKSLLVKVTSAQLPRLLALTRLCGLAVTTSTVQPTATPPKGLIRCRLLGKLSCEDILERLEAQGVTGVRRLVSALDPKREPGYVLSFGEEPVPEKIKVCGMRIPVGAYSQPPLRCFGCQRYGHAKAACGRRRACPRCATPHDGAHDEENCTLPPRCVSCRGPHDARATSCPQYRREATAKRLAKAEGVTVADAKVLLTQQRQAPAQPRRDSREVSASISYASVSSSQLATQPPAAQPISCQCSSLESRVAALESIAASVASLAQTMAGLTANLNSLTSTVTMLAAKVESLASADRSGETSPKKKRQKSSPARKYAGAGGKSNSIPAVQPADVDMEDTDSSTTSIKQ